MALTTVDKYHVVQSLASGKTVSAVSAELGHSRETINKVKAERRDQIERETAKYLQSLPKAVDQQVQLINQFDTVSSIDDPTRFKACVQAGQDMLKAVGILPTNANSIAIKNIYNDNRSVILSDNISQILSKLIPHMVDDDIPHMVEDEIINSPDQTLD